MKVKPKTKTTIDHPTITQSVEVNKGIFILFASQETPTYLLCTAVSLLGDVSCSLYQ